MASIEFHISPTTIRIGEAAVLQWDIEGVREIYLDGQGVTGHESRTVIPFETTTYSLRIVLQDNTETTRTATVTVDETPAIHTQVTREPTVVISEENKQRLRQYPRPLGDNGRGLHFHTQLEDATIAQSVERLKSINAKWTLIYPQDELQAKRAAKACWDAGIMPVSRIGHQIDGQVLDPIQYVNALQEVGAPLYFQIYNEPNDPREWEGSRPSDYREYFARKWTDHAVAIFDAGGYPGLQVMGKSELDVVIDTVAARGRTDIWQRAFFAMHNYGGNHPPAYPYTIGKTAVEDRLTVLSFLAFAVWMQERLGFVLPMIGGEGGWQFDNQDDRGYPKIQEKLHALYHRELFEWFRTGVLSNGEPLPDYLFSVTTWILGGWPTTESWWGSTAGTHQATIDAVRTIQPFERHFSWEREDDADTGDGGTPVDGEDVSSDDRPGVDDDPGEGGTPGEGNDSDGGDEPNTAPEHPLAWDPRLDQLGVRITRSEASPAWRLVKAAYRDETESDNRHHVDIIALQTDGSPAQGVRFVVDWVGRHAHENPGYVTTDSDGKGNYPIYTVLHPEWKDGKNFAALIDGQGDRVDGMGLPINHHVCYELTYQYR